MALGGCRQEALNPACPPLPESWSPSREEALFLNLAFEQEFGASSEGLRKWNTPIRIFIEGEAPPESLSEIQKVIDELNSISKFISISEVSNLSQANFRVFLGTKEDYVASIEPAASGFAQGNSGFATIAWGNSFEIIRASVCLDVVNFPDLNTQKHIFREEMAQALGLINDTELEPNSIFHQFIESSIAYDELDSLMIHYILGNELRAGMCPSEVIGIIP